MNTIIRCKYSLSYLVWKIANYNILNPKKNMYTLNVHILDADSANTSLENIEVDEAFLDMVNENSTSKKYFDYKKSIWNKYTRFFSVILNNVNIWILASETSIAESSAHSSAHSCDSHADVNEAGEE